VNCIIWMVCQLQLEISQRKVSEAALACLKLYTWQFITNNQ
jgi:hypothetical protein